MVAAIVLAGGASRRFGEDKTRARVDGVEVLQRVIDSVRAVRPVIDQIVVIGPWAPAGVAHLLEPERLQGPLAAISFGLAQVRADSALVLGGDHPLLVPSLLEHLVERLTTPPPGGAAAPDAVVPRGPTGPEPLVACYRAAIRPQVDHLVDGGERRMRALLDTVDTEYVEPSDWQRFDPDGRSLLDIDTPADLQRVQQLLATAG
ncbi:molybdenum cofactor guanylyltransferase [soil metagenome]